MVHEVLGGDAVKPHVPLLFCGEVGLFYRRDDFLLDRGVYILIEIVDYPPLLVYIICVGSFRF